jgi:hypothetical protein
MSVEDQIAEIKRFMPLTYGAIQEKAKTMGPMAYGLVRRGLRGERNCFYARERIREPGKLDRWLVAGTGAGMPDLVPELLERELRLEDIGIDMVFVLNNPDEPDSARACTPAGGADGAN